MEGKQVVLKVESVNEELGEILCTPVAVSADAPFIELVKDKDYTVTLGPTTPARKAPTEEEVFQKLLMDIHNLENELFKKGHR